MNIPYVSVPDDNSGVSREQFVSAVSCFGTNIFWLRARYEGRLSKDGKYEGFDHSKPSLLDEKEEILYKRIGDDATALAERHNLSNLEKLALEAPPAPLPPEEIEVTEEIDKLFKSGAPLNLFTRNRRSHEVLRLAIELLRMAGGSVEDEVPALLKRLAETRETSYHRGRRETHGAPVFVCPRCEGDGALGSNRYKRDDCKRCKGLGYLFQTEEIDEYEDEDACVDRAGRLARNKGETWTIDQEVKARGYQTVKEFVDDGNSIETLPPSFRDSARSFDGAIHEEDEEIEAAKEEGTSEEPF